jgi:hypothetical protein
MLARDIQVDGVIVAPIGSKEWGHASFIGGDGKAMQVGLDHVRIKVGDTSVPLRSTPLREGGAAQHDGDPTRVFNAMIIQCTWPRMSPSHRHGERIKPVVDLAG